MHPSAFSLLGKTSAIVVGFVFSLLCLDRVVFVVAVVVVFLVQRVIKHLRPGSNRLWRVIILNPVGISCRCYRLHPPASFQDPFSCFVFVRFNSKRVEQFKNEAGAAIPRATVGPFFKDDNITCFITYQTSS